MTDNQRIEELERRVRELERRNPEFISPDAPVTHPVTVTVPYVAPARIPTYDPYQWARYEGYWD